MLKVSKCHKAKPSGTEYLTSGGSEVGYEERSVRRGARGGEREGWHIQAVLEKHPFLVLSTFSGMYTPPLPSIRVR